MKDARNASWLEPDFRLDRPVLAGHELGLEAASGVDAEADHGADDADEDAQEGEAGLSRVEAVTLLKDEREALKPDVD